MIRTTEFRELILLTKVSIKKYKHKDQSMSQIPTSKNFSSVLSSEFLSNQTEQLKQRVGKEPYTYIENKREREYKENEGIGWVENSTGIAAADHENRRKSGDEVADKRAEGRVALVPVEGATFLDVAGVPVEGVAIVVGVAARLVPQHLLLLLLLL